jgi:HNH endonuclease
MTALADLPPRMQAKIQPASTGCWLWTSALSDDGYGRFWLDGGPQQAHRAAYELLVGAIPDGLTIDHLCRVRHCVNPDHMEPVTIGENVRRARSLITHCPQGHEYVGHNVRLFSRPDGGYARGCRECHNTNRRLARYARQAAAKQQKQPA